MSGRSAGYCHPDKTLIAKALVRPSNTDEVSKVLKLCNEQHPPVVSHGGLTGLVGGNIGGEYEIILGLERMRRIEEIDEPILAQWTDRKLAVFGHLGDGNLHIVYAVGENGSNVKKLINDAVYYPLASQGGSFSAEYGIDLQKKEYLDVSRCPAGIDLMKQL